MSADIKRRVSARELVRMAMMYAIQDREAMAESCCPSDPYGAVAAVEAKMFRAYLRRRYGQKHASEVERLSDGATSISIDSIRREANEARATSERLPSLREDQKPPSPTKEIRR